MNCCTRHIDTWVFAHAGQWLVIMGTTNLETLALKNDAIKSHCLCRFIHRTELHGNKIIRDYTIGKLLSFHVSKPSPGRTNDMFISIQGSNLKEGKILILVDLHCKDRVSRGLSKTTQTHLGIEEVHHRLLKQE